MITENDKKRNSYKDNEDNIAKKQEKEFENLRYFATVRVPRELHDTFKQFEDILQQEHDESGRHPICDESRDGFMSAGDKIELIALRKEIDELRKIVESLQ